MILLIIFKINHCSKLVQGLSSWGMWKGKYLSIYLYINFAKRPGSLTEQAPPRVPEKKRKEKKISNTTHQNDNTLETTRKETEMQKQN